MKVLQFIASTGWGGAEKVFVELANKLAAECDVYVLLLKGTVYVDRFNPGITVITAPVHGSRRNPLLLFFLYKTIREIDPDIVHTHAAKASEMVYFISRFCTVRQVATKHNARKGKIFNRVQWVTTVSEQAAKTIHQKAPVQIIHNGINPRKIPKQEKQSPFSIIAVGRLDSYKGFDTLIRQAREISIDFILNIIGEGSERSSLAKLIHDLQLEKKIFLPGHREDIPELLAQSHLQVISSRTEGFSLAAIEGLFYADLLLSTKVGIAAEIMPDALLCNASDIGAKINDICHNYEYYREIFQKTVHKQQNRFLLSSVACAYLEFYNRVLEETINNS